MSLRTALSIVIAASAFVLGSLRGVRATPAVVGFDETTVAKGFAAPVAIAFLPSGRMLVAELGGGLYVSDGINTLLTTIPVAPTCDVLDFETGLLGIAVDPNFDTNGYIYLYRTNDHGHACNYPPDGWTNEVIRVTMGPGDTIDLDTLTVLLPGIRCLWGYHNGGGLRIGPDQKLYVGVGDSYDGDEGATGPGTSTNIYAQDLNALEGKVLRLNLDGTIPSDNPFEGQLDKRGEIWAYGFRNPFRFAFDPTNDRLWLGDVGQDDVEEVDIVAKGKNYSWPHCEGNLPNGCLGNQEVAPVFTYQHTGPEPDRAITGGGFSGELFGARARDYFYGDFETSEIYRLRPNTGRTGVVGGAEVFVTEADGPVDVQFGSDGALYYASIFSGEIRRVAPSFGGDQPVAGKKLVLKGGLSKKKVSVLAKDLVLLSLSPIDNPTLTGGSLRIAGLGFDNTYNLPPSGWSAIGMPGAIKGFKYQDGSGAHGPITLVQITDGKMIKVLGKGTGLGHTIGEFDPSPVGVVVTTGARRFCMSFGGTARLNPQRQFTAANAPAPSSCP